MDNHVVFWAEMNGGLGHASGSKLAISGFGVGLHCQVSCRARGPQVCVGVFEKAIRFGIVAMTQADSLMLLQTRETL